VLSNKRCREKFLLWLQEATAHDTEREIKLALGRGDTVAAIFAALAGGNISKATQLSMDNGYLRLASLLSSAGTQSFSDLRQQMESWHGSGATDSVPHGLLRVYSLLSGDEEVEENLHKNGVSSLDWRRRLALRLWSGDKDELFSVVFQQFDLDAKRGIVPAPHPRYVSGSRPYTEGSQCLLYGLLQLGHVGYESASNGRPHSLRDVISPSSHTSSIHDFSTSFHLSTVLSALGCYGQLTAVEEARLVDSYVMQLVQAGCWEWAVFICLCVSGEAVCGMKEVWQSRAKEIVVRNCAGDIKSKRSFLESDVGIPAQWFDESLAFRAAYVFDPMSHAHFMTQVSYQEALRTYEELWMPNILFKGGAQHLVEALEAMGDASLTGWKSLNEQGISYPFLALCKEVLWLSQLSGTEQKARCGRIEELKVLAKELMVRVGIEGQGGKAPNKLLLGMTNIPKSVSVAELMSSISILDMQLSALQEGVSIFRDQQIIGGRRLKLASQLAFLCSQDTLNYPLDMLGAQDVQRGQFGIA